MCGPSRIHDSPAPGVQRKNFSDKNLFRFSSSFCSWDSFFVSLACMTGTKIVEGNIRKRVSECRWKSLLYPITFSLFCILAAYKANFAKKPLYFREGDGMSKFPNIVLEGAKLG